MRALPPFLLAVSATALSQLLAAAQPLPAQPPAGHPGKIVKIESLGEFLREPNLPGERRADDVVPGQTSGLRLSKERWLVLCCTRGFRGVDDERSTVYQIRKGAPDGPVLKEGFLARSVTDWDPLGDGVKRVKQHGHLVGFGVPKGALIGGKPAPHANHFVALWRVLAVPYDPVKKAVPRTPPDLVRKTQGVEWVQFRLNADESDLEFVHPVGRLRQVGYEQGAAFCSLPVATMNQSFVQPVPANADCTEWLLCNHFDGGRIAALKLAFDARAKLYRWVSSGPLTGGGKQPLSEASLARPGNEWLVAARVSGKTQGIAWGRTRDPLAALPELKLGAVPATNAPFTLFVCGDGVPRVFTGDYKASPHRRGRDPLYVWRVDAANGFACTERATVFDTVAAQLPFRNAAQAKVDFARLFPVHGKTQLVTYRVNVRSNNFGYPNRPDIPPILTAEKARCGVYHSRITYADVVPEPWTFPADR